MRLVRWPASLVDRRHSRPARIALRLIALGVLTVLPGGCGQLKAAEQTGQALARAGYKQAGVNVNTSVLNGQSSQTVVQVRYSSRASDDAALGAEQDKAAQIVWENAPVRLSAVMVTAITHQVGVPGVGGAQTSRGRAYSRQELASSYGPRPAGLDKQPASGVPPVVANLLAVLVLVGAVAVVVLLAVLTFRRRRRPVSGAWGPPGQQWPSQWPSQWQGRPTPGWGPPGPPTSPPANEVQPGEGASGPGAAPPS
jgi:cobalamin biosynthesis Mg chelatase CobN